MTDASVSGNKKAPAIVYDSIAYNAWVDAQRQPGDQPGEVGAASALLRRVKMHLFVASGGVVIDTTSGITTYGQPVNPVTNPECPWHGEGCSAWEAIKATPADKLEAEGFTINGPTLRELRERTPEEIAEAKKMDEIERIAHNHGGLSRKSAKAVSDAEDRFQAGRATRGLPPTTPTTHAAPFESRDEREARATRESASADLADAASSLGDEIVIDGDEDDPDESGLAVSGNSDASASGEQEQEG